MAGLNSFYISSVLITARTWGDWTNTNGRQSSQAAIKYIKACKKGQMRAAETPPSPLSSVVTQEHNHCLTCLMGFVRLTTQTERGCKRDSEGMRSAAFRNWNSQEKKAQFASGGLIYTLFVAVISCGCNLGVCFSQSVRGHLGATGCYKSGTDTGKKKNPQKTITIITPRVKGHKRTTDLGKKKKSTLYLRHGHCQRGDAE